MMPPRPKLPWLGKAAACVAAGLVVGSFGGIANSQLSAVMEPTEALAEVVLAVCLFCAGLKIAGPLDWKTWRVPLGLACITLPVTVALAAGAANVFLGLPMQEALLLGAILGPTDSVLASNIRLQSASAETTRFALVVEGALGTCLAFPGLLFALGLNGDHELGPFALRWVGVDVAWALGGGAICGWFAGTVVVRGFERLGPRGWIGHRRALGFAELAGLASALALACGATYLLAANPFVAALAAGTAIVRAGSFSAGAVSASRRAQALAALAARIERVAELVFLVGLGALLVVSQFRAALALYAFLILIAVRPLAAGLAFRAPRADDPERRTVAWFGMRGAPSICYLVFAIDRSLSAHVASELISATTCALVVSLALHGLTALPLGKRPARERG